MKITVPDPAGSPQEAILLLLEGCLAQALSARLDDELELAQFESRVIVLVRNGIPDPTWTGNPWKSQRASLQSRLEESCRAADFWELALTHARHRLS